jgi:hypothetical protein
MSGLALRIITYFAIMPLNLNLNLKKKKKKKTIIAGQVRHNCILLPKIPLMLLINKIKNIY